MRRQICSLSSDGYPYYLHNNVELVDYWKRYFDKFPLEDDDSFEIYIDFPFCRSICKFCVYGSNTYAERKDDIKYYEDAVVNQIISMRDTFPNRLNDIYFGGGTPTLWSEDAIREIIKNIPTYHLGKNRTIETHPFDLTDDKLDFIIDEMKVLTVSIGVQSFDIDANKGQRRIPVDVHKLKHAVERLHEAGIYVNCDLVALFNEDSENGWRTFENDLDIAATIIKPDDICSNPNFRIKNYYNKSVRYRQILKKFLEKYPQYELDPEIALSTDINDIIAYAEDAYHLTTPECHDFFENSGEAILGYDPEVIKKNIIMGFGGAPGHNGISRVGKKFEDINSYFSFRERRFIHQVRKVKIVEEYTDGDEIPDIRIGNCNIDGTIIE